MNNTKNRAWCFAAPAWYDHAKENEENWWDPRARVWRPMGTTRITLSERNQACHAERFAQWAAYRLADEAPSRGLAAMRRAIMRLVAAWREYGWSRVEDKILDAWFSGAKEILDLDEELAEAARQFGYREIAEILNPPADTLDEGGLKSMHKHVHW